jgi:hypothetical protein
MEMENSLLLFFSQLHYFFHSLCYFPHKFFYIKLLLKDFPFNSRICGKIIEIEF